MKHATGMWPGKNTTEPHPRWPNPQRSTLDACMHATRPWHVSMQSMHAMDHRTKMPCMSALCRSNEPSQGVHEDMQHVSN